MSRSPSNLPSAERPTLWYRFGWHFFRAIFRVYFRWRVYYPERVPLEGPLIVAANHASFLDPPLVGSAAPRPLYYMARETLFRNPILRTIIRGWNAVPVARDTASSRGLKAAVDLLEAGHAVLVFPEGTRSRDGHLQPAQAGVGLLVARVACPVVPVRIINSHRALPRGAFLPRPVRIEVLFGEPMDMHLWRERMAHAPSFARKDLYRQTAQAIMDAIAALQPPQKEKKQSSR